MTLPSFRTWIFDCDGVLLDSNHVKTEAFRELARPYGDAVADELAEYHRRTGGQSRFVKVRYLHETLLGRAPTEDELDAEARRYGDIVRRRLLGCSVVPGVRELLSAVPTASRKFVVSGGLESEVAWALGEHGLASAFDGIYGSPRKKDEIFAELRDRGELANAVYLGDARYDYEVAGRFGVTFVFVSGCTEFDGWREFFEGKNDVTVVGSFRELRTA